MNIDTEILADCTRVRFSGEATIKHVRQLHAVLCEACLSANRIEIDASELESLDTAIVQLLIATRKSLPNTVLKISDSPEVVTTLQQCGAANLLNSAVA